jgi:cytochrome c oxidase subunit 2
MVDAKDELKAQLKANPAFRAELKERIKAALGARLPAAQPVSYNFDSYMLQDIQVRAAYAGDGRVW